MNNFKIFTIFIVIILVIYSFNGMRQQHSTHTLSQHPNQSQFDSNQDDLQKITTAFQNQQSKLQVLGKGQVVKILADDNIGLRHQKFIIKLDNGLSLLIAHNIDLAARIPSLQIGDTVQFYGEYIYTNKGGVIHWTHHDPQHKHIDGWLKHKGNIYQ